MEGLARRLLGGDAVFRVGTKLGRTVYVRIEDEPEVFVGIFDDAQVAKFACESMNSVMLSWYTGERPILPSIDPAP
jgi:hypothetical protein